MYLQWTVPFMGLAINNSLESGGFQRHSKSLIYMHTAEGGGERGGGGGSEWEERNKTPQ